MDRLLDIDLKEYLVSRTLFRSQEAIFCLHWGRINKVAAVSFLCVLDAVSENKTEFTGKNTP